MFIQIFLVIFFVFAFIKVIERYRKKELGKFMTIGWSLCWILGIVIVLLPNSTFYFAKFLGVGRGADLIVYLSIAMIFFVIFRLTVNVEHMKREITILTRKIALADQNSKNVDSE